MIKKSKKMPVEWYQDSAEGFANGFEAGLNGDRYKRPHVPHYIKYPDEYISAFQEGFKEGKALRGGYSTANDAPGRFRSRRQRISTEQRKFISRKIRMLVHEGYPQRQAIAIAYRMAGVPRRDA